MKELLTVILVLLVTTASAQRRPVLDSLGNIYYFTNDTVEVIPTKVISAMNSKDTMKVILEAERKSAPKRNKSSIRKQKKRLHK